MTNIIKEIVEEHFGNRLKRFSSKTVLIDKLKQAISKELDRIKRPFSIKDVKRSLGLEVEDAT